jgi:GNAT superfamily N-acetyltransferase
VDAADVETRPVGPAELADLATLFEQTRNTRHCWCAAFCTTRGQFALGWFHGGNRRRFEAIARGAEVPMGILATVKGTPVGWCACGPRSRYLVGGAGLLHGRVVSEDDDVWLLPCLFVRPEHRNEGVTYALARAAVELAGSNGATAVEGWPTSTAVGQPADGFLGREKMFESLGFTCTSRPTPQRAIMRLDLNRG